MADDAIASAAVYSDTDGDRLNPELKMVMTLMVMINEGEDLGSVSDGQKEVEAPVIVWESNGRRVLMNDYEDRGYISLLFFRTEKAAISLALMRIILLCHWKYGLSGYSVIIREGE